MSHYKMAVVVIHGIGNQFKNKNAKPVINQPAFSRYLYKNVSQKLDKSGVSIDQVAWCEVVWADVLQYRQKKYLNTIKRDRLTRCNCCRKIIVNTLSDAAAYRKTRDGDGSTYQDIHAKIDEVMDTVEQKVGPEAPVLILAHSLGGHIMSNYIYDSQKNNHSNPKKSSVCNMQTVVKIITFGCNIPLFLFAYRKSEIKPIKSPDTKVPLSLRNHTWWCNFYGKYDVLGYPLEGAPGYGELIESKKIIDVPVNAGNVFTSRNPVLSHKLYWKNKNIRNCVATTIQSTLSALPQAPASAGG